MSKNSGVKGKTVPALARSMGAAKRLAARAQRTPEQQLALLDGRPGESHSERLRLGYKALAADPEFVSHNRIQPAKRTRRRGSRKAGAA